MEAKVVQKDNRYAELTFTFLLYSCQTCGAIVADLGRRDHDEWHEADADRVTT